MHRRGREFGQATLAWPRGVEHDLESGGARAIDEFVRAQAVLVQECVVPEPPLAIGIAQVVELVDASVDVGVVVAAIDRVEHRATRAQHAHRLAVERVDDRGRHVLEHAVGEDQVDLARPDSGRGRVGRRATGDRACARGFERGTAFEFGEQSRMSCAHASRIDARDLRDRVELAPEAPRAREREVGAQVRVEVEAADSARAREMAGQREGRVPAGADLEQVAVDDVDARLAQALEHDAPVIELGRELAFEVAQAAEAPLQPIVEVPAARQHAEQLLQQALGFPVHATRALSRRRR